MQKLISATFIFLFCATLMQAQDLGYVPGAVVTLKKDTLKGYICWLNKLYRQNKIVMYEIKDKKHVRIGYIPERIKGFVLEGNYYESIKYSDEKNHEEGNFAHRKIDGEMKLYAWVVLNPHGKKRWPEHPDSKIDDTELATEDLIKKGNGEVQNMNTFKWMRFEKNMAEFVKEDKELAKKITDLTYKRADLEKIVTEYNEWYKENGKKRPPLKKN